MRISKSEPLPCSPDVSCTWGANCDRGAGPRCGASSLVSSRAKEESAEGLAAATYTPASSGTRCANSAAAAKPSAEGDCSCSFFLINTRSSRYCLLERNRSETAAEYCERSVMFCCTQYVRK